MPSPEIRDFTDPLDPTETELAASPAALRRPRRVVLPRERLQKPRCPSLPRALGAAGLARASGGGTVTGAGTGALLPAGAVAVSRRLSPGVFQPISG